MNDFRNPIANIWAIGRNYADHAKELGHAIPETSSEPMIFLKSGSSIVENGARFYLPAFSQDIHHECEVALRFNSEGGFSEFTVALDLTARDIQNQLKSKSHPWTLAKSFKASCPIGPLTPIPKDLDLQALNFDLRVNGVVKQNGWTKDMIHPIEKIRRFVLDRFPVNPGDLLLTGTPVGVGPLQAGDDLEAEIKGHLKAHWQIAQAL